MAEATTAPAVTRRVRVWDLPTRIFHWLLVSLIVLAWASYEYSEALNDPTLKLHRYTGYLILILMLWRLIWGLIGSSSSRFRAFVKRPIDVIRYTRALLRARPPRYLGHNPLGSYGVLMLLGVISLQGILGLMSEEHNGVTWGPLSHLTNMAEEITDWHSDVFYYGILVIVGLHIAANLYHAFVEREPLIRAMVTGTKPGMASEYEDPETKVCDKRVQTAILALLALAASAAIFYSAIVLLGGRLFY